MPRVTFSGFMGSVKAVDPRLIADGQGEDSINQMPQAGELVPWKVPNAVATVPSSPQRKTIYRMGRDVASDANYWLSWPSVVHAVRGFIASDTSERTYYTGDSTPKVTDNTIALATTPYPTAYRLLGVPAPTSFTLSEATAGTGTDELRYVVQTWVTDKGEESKPSATASITCKPGAVLNLNGLAVPPGNRGITIRRVYITKSGTSGSADFFFVGEFTATVTAGVQINTANLGADTLATTGWELPPDDLSHLTPLWNGMMAGISGRSVRYCETYKPYAWPVAYETLLGDLTPVALATFSGTLLILTNGEPKVVTGSLPDSMGDEPTEFSEAACVSDRSVASGGTWVAWAAPDGLAYFGAKGRGIITQNLLKPEQWRALNPSTVVGCAWNGKYFGFYDSGAGLKGFCIEIENPTGIYWLTDGYSAAFVDKLQNALYVLDGGNIKRWNAGASLMTATFRSKVDISQQAINYARIRVVARTYPVTVRLYGDGTLRATKTITSRAVDTLPGGYECNEHQIEVDCVGAVIGIDLATSSRAMSA